MIALRKIAFDSRFLALWLAAALAAALPARAQWAVVDAPAIVQLVQEVRTLQQQLQTARDQLVQAKQALSSMTGARGMERLLTGTARNYLPSNWTDLSNVLHGGGYFALASDMQRALNATAVLSARQLAAMPAEAQRQIAAARQTSALRQALAQEALANASGRFAALQSLIAAIPAAGDQKAILDLQARIGAELGMLQNEHTKLEVLYQATLAQESANRQQELEQAIAGHGRFATRLQPTP